MAGFGFPIVNVFGIDIVSFTIGLGIFFGIYLIITLSLNLEMGYTGIPNFGKLLYVAGGSAVAAALSGRLAVYLLNINTYGNYVLYSVTAMQQVNTVLAASPLLSMGVFVLSLAIGGGVGAAFGYVSSYPAIRLREDYLGMLLLASAQFFAIFLTAYEPLVGGEQPVGVPDPFLWAGSGREVSEFLALALILSFAGLVYLYSERVARSPLGRTLRSVRDNEVASAAVGKDNVAIRNKILIIASAMCGSAGALWGMFLASNDATYWTRFDWTIVPWVMVIIGGAGSNLGTAIGTFAFSFIIKIITQAGLAFGDLQLPIGIINNAGSFALQFMPLNINRIEFLVVGVALILVLYLRPEGIWREKPTFTMSRSRILGLFAGTTERKKDPVP